MVTNLLKEHENNVITYIVFWMIIVLINCIYLYFLTISLLHKELNLKDIFCIF